MDALVVNPGDNVATALRQLEKDRCVNVILGENEVSISLSGLIPVGHKFAVDVIETGAPVIKYGEIIGLATTRISKGDHVHIHNVEGRKGRGDRR